MSSVEMKPAPPPKPAAAATNEDDDWETDPDFVVG